MTDQRLLFDGAAQARVQRGAEVLARAVRVTLGPRGRTVLLEAASGPPNVTREGARVAEAIALADPFENIGARLLRQAAQDTRAVTGDGSSTATLLAYAILQGGLHAVSAGLEGSAVKRGIARATEAVAAELRRIALPLEDPGRIAQVATVAANGEPEIGALIARAAAAVGPDGLILIEPGRAADDRLEILPGMSFDRGYLSRHFVTDEATMSVALRRPCLLLCEKRISDLVPLIALFDRILELKRPLLIVAEEIESEALATLVINRQRGGLKVAAVRSPGFAGHRRTSLEDLAVLTGATVILGEPGLDLADATPAMLGRADRVRITHARTEIIGGGGAPEAIRRRCARLRRERDRTESPAERERLGRRLGRLSGGIAVIRAGGFSEAAIAERSVRLEKARRAVQSARESGLVPGGGAALLHAARALAGLSADSRDEQAGIAVVRRALAAPLFAIAQNAGADARAVVAKVAAEGGPRFGFDAMTSTFGDMTQSGILDPAALVETALRRAASVAGLLLELGAVVGARPPVKVPRHPFACKCSDHDHHHYPGDPYHEHHHP